MMRLYFIKMRYIRPGKKIKNFKEFRHPREFENPFFKKKNSFNSSRRGVRLKIDFILLFLALGGWIYFLFFSSYFSVIDIAVSGNKELTKKSLEDYLTRSYNKNIFFLNTAKISFGMTDNFILKGADIKKIYPRALVVNVVERNPEYAIFYEKRFALMDGEGVAFKELKDLSSFYNASSTPGAADIFKEYEDLKSGYQFLMFSTPARGGKGGNFNTGGNNRGAEIYKQKFLSELKKTYGVEKISEDFKIKYITIKGENDPKIIITLLNNIEVYFDLDLDVPTQINHLQVLYAEKLNKMMSSLKYIDLRFGEKIYFK